ncbi:outer membrane protein assembly factor BamB family protein [Methanococcoides sp.]|uniref:outer membrane protein assembly factor BamB family protein n=1 Tax=Methanococcoides sp. TaxID=1966350 RepID=UPI00272DF28C|nr:PQQ-binding-like beta-propeller repeat protein [Methanococcoides sp.]
MNKKMKTIIIPIVFLSLVLLISPAMAEETTTYPWEQFLRDPAHSGLYQSTLPEAYELSWTSSDIDAVFDATPVVAEGKVFVNCDWESTSLKALNVSTGAVLWTTPVDEVQFMSWSSPAYHDGMVFTSTGRNTTCVNAATGNVEWTFTNPTGEASCNGGPMIADGKVFCSDWAGGHYYCLDEYTTYPNGHELWSFAVATTSSGNGLEGPRAQGTAAYKDGKVFLTSYDYNAPSYDGYVYCVYADNGSEIWTTGITDNACGSPAVGDGVVYVTTYNFYGDSAVYALDITDGSILWETPILRTDSTPAIAYGNIYVSTGYIQHKVYCINASSGSIVWETDASDEIGGWTASVAVADGKVFAGKVSESSAMVPGYTDLVELDAYTGDILWKATGGATPAISDGIIYTIAEDGNVYAYDSATPTMDIVTDDVSLSTENAYPFYDNEITATIRNDGNKNVNNVSVSLKENGTEVDSHTISVLGGGCSRNVDFTWAPSAPGNYEMTVESYSTDPITETDTTNNEMSIYVTALSGDPDLEATEITPSAVYVDQSYEMKATVANVGYAVADSFTVEVKEGTTVLTTETITSLGPAQSADITFTWMSTTAGNVDLTVNVDTGDIVTEEDETNNQLVQAIEVKPETPIEVLLNSDWSQFQNSNDRNGVTDDYGLSESSVSLKWSADEFNGNIDVTPVVVEDMVYVIANSGVVYAYDKNDGTPVWHRETGDATDLQSSIPAYGDGNLFVATKSGNLYAFNSTIGTPQWEVHVTDDSFECPVTYHDHRIYVADGIAQGVGTKYYYCYDDMGTKLWSYAIPDSAGFIWNGASIVGDYIMFSTHEGKLISLDRKAGTLVDEVSLDSNVSSEISFAKTDPGIFRSSLVYQDGYVYTSSERGQSMGYVWKVGFDAVTGTFSNQGWCSDQIFSTSTPAIHDGKVYVGQGEHGYPGELICLDDNTGTELWSYSVPNGVKSSPVVSTYYDKPCIYFTSAMMDGSLYCLDGDGELIWEYNAPDTDYVLQGAAISDGKVYFGTNGGYLYCLGSDWNPWNDVPSANGRYIAIGEVIDAYNCWRFTDPAPSGELIPIGSVIDMYNAWRFTEQM